MARDYTGLHSELSSIGAGLAEYARQEKAKKDYFDMLQRKSDIEMQQALGLARQKQMLEQEAIRNRLPQIVPIDNTASAPMVSMGSVVPEGMEISGYTVKGQPIIRKIKPNIQEEKFKLQEEEKKKIQDIKSEQVKQSVKDTLATISEVEKGINQFGLLGGLPSIPGTSRVNWESNINKLLSGKVLDTMNKMKEASRTGATGFGALNQSELAILQNASTALKKTLSPQDAQRYLNDMKTSLYKILQEENINPDTIRTNKTKSGITFSYKKVGG